MLYFFFLNTFYVDNCHESGKIERAKAKENEDAVQMKPSENGKLDVDGWWKRSQSLSYTYFFSTICLNFSFLFISTNYILPALNTTNNNNSRKSSAMLFTQREKSTRLRIFKEAEKYLRFQEQRGYILRTLGYSLGC